MMPNEWTYVSMGRERWIERIPTIPSPSDYWISRWFNNFNGEAISHGIEVTADKVRSKPGFFKAPEDAHRYAFGVMKSHHAEQERIKAEKERIENSGFIASLQETIDGEISI